MGATPSGKPVPHVAESSPPRAAATSSAAPVPGQPPPVQSSSGSSAATAAQPLQPPTTGRKVVQSAQLNLTATASRVDAVAQEVYNVVGQVNGIVNSSTVTQGGPNGYASSS